MSAARAARPATGHEPAWPSHFLSLAHVQTWIAAALVPTQGRIRVADPVQVYEAKTRAVTARFTVQSPDRPDEDVVFKATLQPLFYYAPLVDRLVMQVCPEHVPSLLAAEVLNGPTFTHGRPRGGMSPEVIDRQQGRLYSLYRPFTGPLVRQLLDRISEGGPPAATAAKAAVSEVTRAFARIQVGVAAAPDGSKVGIPRMPVSQLPALYDDMLRRIQRERALELAARLVVVKDAYTGEVIRDAEGFAAVYPRGALRFLQRVLARWRDEE